MRSLLCAAAALAALGVSQTAAPAAIPSYVQAAVAESTRPEKDRGRDADRKPDQVLAFAGVKPGDKVGELMPGGGYYTRLLCKVVGANGQVYAVSMKRADQPDRPPPPPDPSVTPNPCTNVTASSTNASELALPDGLDVVWTTENYHDLHNKMFGSPDIKQLDSAIFKALKPGGVFIIEDHAAEAGSGARDTDTLHRIDPELVKKEVTGVGFKLVGQSALLHHADDPHTAKVFDLKGKSDKFLFKFQKPKH